MSDLSDVPAGCIGNVLQVSSDNVCRVLLEKHSHQEDNYPNQMGCKSLVVCT